MTKLAKRMKAIREKVEHGKVYSLQEGLDTLLNIAKEHPVKFIESVDVSINLGIDARKQSVRGATDLPHGSGKTVRIAVFAQGPNAEAAKEAGADVVGFEDLAESMKKGQLDYDVVIASPDAMGIVGKLGQVLGPRGLMPNPKVGTVTPNVGDAVQKAKAGQAIFRADKNGIVHAGVGRINFSAAHIAENVKALLADIRKLKPTGVTGTYIKKLTLSTTMGVGIVVDVNDL
ncbi:MAG: 50S ribosomal protein L1 [Gammaproteobacteria bacterium]